MSKETLGFIGVGNMGGPMAARLLQQGWHVVVFDPDAKAVEALIALGARKADSIVELADCASTVLLSLPTPAVVQEVVSILSGGKQVRRVVDFSTIGPAAASQASTHLAQTDVAYVDSPVSGGVPGARDGKLALMVACGRADFDSLQPVLQVFGKTFHVGEKAGQAQILKLANNLLSASAIAVSSEVMAMGVKGGLDPRVMLDVINASSGRNSATQDKFPRSILPGTFDFGFATGLAYKDVRLCIDEAARLGVPMPAGAAIREVLAITNAVYGPDSDYTSMCRLVESWAGVQVRA